VDNEDKMFVCTESYIPTHNSQWLYQAILHEMMVNDRRVCIASFEITGANMLFNLLWMLHGRSPSKERLQEELAVFQDRLWFIEGDEGQETWEGLRDDFTYANKRFGCDLFVIDALMHLTKKGDAEGSDKVAKGCAKWCVKNDVSTLMVAHADAKKRRSGDDIPEVEDILGGQGIGAAAHSVVSIWRNRAKQKETEDRGFEDDEKPDGKMYVCKQRATGNVVLKPIWFCTKTRTFGLSPEHKKPKTFNQQSLTNEDPF